MPLRSSARWSVASARSQISSLAEPLLGPGGELEVELEAERRAHQPVHLVEAEEDLVLDLLHGAEDVAVVLLRPRTREQPGSAPDCSLR